MWLELSQSVSKLTQIASFWFNRTEGQLSNHVFQPSGERQHMMQCIRGEMSSYCQQSDQIRTCFHKLDCSTQSVFLSLPQNWRRCASLQKFWLAQVDPFEIEESTFRDWWRCKMDVVLCDLSLQKNVAIPSIDVMSKKNDNCWYWFPRCSRWHSAAEISSKK